MTLVVRSFKDGFPLMWADVLVTSEARHEEDVRPPTVEAGSDHATELKRLKYVPVGLKQKILCHPNLLVGCCGDAEIAADTMWRLNALGMARKVTWERISSIMKTVPPGADLGIVGWFYEGETLMGFERGNVREQKLPNGVRIAYMGSGALHLDVYAEQMASCRVTTGGERDPDPARESIKFAFYMIESLLRADLETLDTARSAFGGAYEIAVLGANGFVKLNDLEYIFWEAEVEGEDFLLPEFPREFYRMGYLEDLLVVRATRDKFRQENWGTEIFNIPPIHREVTSAETELFSRPSRNANLQVHIVAVNENGRRYTFGFVTGLWDESACLIWREGKRSILFSPQDRLHQKMFTFMKHALGKEPPDEVFKRRKAGETK